MGGYGPFYILAAFERRAAARPVNVLPLRFAHYEIRGNIAEFASKSWSRTYRGGVAAASAAVLTDNWGCTVGKAASHTDAPSDIAKTLVLALNRLMNYMRTGPPRLHSTFDRSVVPGVHYEDTHHPVAIAAPDASSTLPNDSHRQVEVEAKSFPTVPFGHDATILELLAMSA